MSMISKWIKGLLVGTLCYVFSMLGVIQVMMLAYFLQQGDPNNYIMMENQQKIQTQEQDEVFLHVIYAYDSRHRNVFVEVEYPKQSIKFQQRTRDDMVEYVGHNISVANLTQKQTYRLKGATIYKVQFKRKTQADYYISEAVFPKGSLADDEKTIKLHWEPSEREIAEKGLMPAFFKGTFVLLMTFVFSHFLSWMALGSTKATKYFKVGYYTIFSGLQALLILFFMFHAFYLFTY